MNVSPPSVPAELTPVAQDYLKAVWSEQEWSTKKVTSKQLSDRLGVGASTVSETVRRLCDQGLLDHAPYGAVELTESGRRLALQMVRRHRLLETFLVNELGYGWDEVHDEAEILEHAVSDLLVERLDARLGRPGRDPHGDPIPAADGTVVRPAAVPMSEMGAGESGVVVRISDADPDALRYLDEIGLGLDARVSVTTRREFAGTLHVAWASPTEAPDDGGRGAAGAGPVAGSTDLGLLAASRVWVHRE
ncbi:metal-dependent transcriptional regulator [Myceligenerans pegani]|uniref:Manganese transport regulator n=1 Tax=Myceligenerans pegani TaxID=2776917 RepID=A0ABR9N239_9MICO|nr:metal-dependent transcriptional regulator [Myceligenerans sp. TRM 65318]MBE1877722.1 metal-dependent transcriptional regulator [Myceligenerans sp. TRM 65318]MBE3019993.1 metal-dependent transcriptional regulator [Myceligenerans sp. TRM 65318]